MFSNASLFRDPSPCNSVPAGPVRKGTMVTLTLSTGGSSLLDDSAALVCCRFGWMSVAATVVGDGTSTQMLCVVPAAASGAATDVPVAVTCNGQCD